MLAVHQGPGQPVAGYGESHCSGFALRPEGGGSGGAAVVAAAVEPLCWQGLH